MYSDDEIRQIVLTLADGNWTGLAIRLYWAEDRRFLNIALELLEEDDDSSIDAALNALQIAKEVVSSEHLPQVLPFLDNPIHWLNALQIVKYIGNASVFPRVLPFLFYPDLEARTEALRVLFVLGYPQLFELCLHLIHDKDVSMRISVILILEEFKNPLALQVLIDKLHDDETSEDNDISVSMYAAHALSRLKDKRAIEPLQDAVLIGSERISRAALQSLWLMEGANLEFFYAEQIYHLHAMTRKEAIRILTEIKTPYYVDSFISISQNDPSYDVQLAAVAALFQLGTKASLEAAAYWEKHFRRNDES